MGEFPSRRDFISMSAAGLAATPALAETPPPRSPSASDFASDGRLLERAYGALHPGLYRYNTPAGMAARFAGLRAQLGRSRDLSQAYLALARLTAAVRCGHSYPNFYNQSDDIQARLFAGRDRLPFHFTWLGGHMVVTRDLTDGSLSRGDVVETIEGVATGMLLNRLMTVSRADGSNDAKRVRNLEIRGFDRWEAFDIYMPMMFPRLVARGAVTLGVLDPASGGARTLEVALMTGAQRRAKSGTGSVKPDPDAPAWRFERTAGGGAWLTMPDWGLYDSKWPWEAWLNARLDEIVDDKAPVLFVDLRGNEGGLDCGDVILSRLVDRDLPRQAAVRKVRYRKVPDDLSAHVSTWDDSFRDWGAQAVGPDGEGFYRLTRYDDDDKGESLIKPAGKPYRGKVVVLIDAVNSSATFQFAQIVKDAGLACLVGETTGGNRRGINGGAFLFLKLPASGIEVDIPLIGVFPTTPQPDAGIEPDIKVARTAADIAREFDAVKAAAMAV